MALTEKALPGLDEEKIMNRLINRVHLARFARKAVAGVAATFYVTLALAPVAHASDTEVYARPPVVTTSIAPTLMMMLDTSGSMSFCMDGSTSGCSADDGANPRRINALLNAMQKVLFGTADGTVTRMPGFVRLGYSRYQLGNNVQNAGGWVKYPARPLDAFVAFNPDGFVEGMVSAGPADAEQVSGSLNLTSPELDLGLGSVGLHFTTLNVPKGATITEAYIEFTANRDSPVTTAKFLIDAQEVGDAPLFSAQDIDSRTYQGAAGETVNDKWLKDQTYRLNVIEPVKFVVNQGDWCGGNATVLRIKRSSGSAEDRWAYSYDANPAKAPRLVVNWTIDPNKTDSCMKKQGTETFFLNAATDDVEYPKGASTATHDRTFLKAAEVTGGVAKQVALRFTLPTLVQGADIQDAYLELTTSTDGATCTGSGKNKVCEYTSVPDIQTGVYDMDNVTYACTATSCAVPSASVVPGNVWTPFNSSGATSTALRTMRSGWVSKVPVTSLMQGVVNRSGWAASNAVGFVLGSTTTASSNPLSFVSRNSSTAAAHPKLWVTYSQKVTDLTQFKTVREEIWEDMSVLKNAGMVDGGTPLGAAFVETMAYMMGMPVMTKGAVDPRTATDSSLTRYKSPVAPSSQCSANYVFALTDGEPNTEANVGSNTPQITGQQCAKWPIEGTEFLNWRCMMDTAQHGLKPNNQVKSRVRTSTVLFGNDADPDVRAENSANMSKVAEIGDGDFFTAGSEKALVDAIIKTVDNLLDVSGSISAPGVAVNQLNRLNNLDQLFYAVFDPKVQGAYWTGNLKRYRLDIAKEEIFDSSEPPIPAVDSTTSFFDADARSWWTTTEEPDGAKAAEGGAASVLPHPSARKMLTYLGGLPSGQSALTPVSLSDSAFTGPARTLMGLDADDVKFQNIVNWYRGYVIGQNESAVVPVSTTSPARNTLGGALHSRPMLVNYGYTGTAAQAAIDPEKQINYVFFSTLDGTLHVMDSRTGVEKFAFIPGERLAVMPKLFANVTQENPEFGMDLTWSVLRKDADGNGIPEKVYVYGGMRMGGSNYYALDVTDLDNPKLLFSIKGGSGGFGKLGQTWSQPVIASMRIGGAVQNVLVFAGGYDAQHETAGTVFSSDGVGNALYIVDADTGDLIWSGDAGDNADMDFSIPSQPKIIDADADGLVDHIYVGDLGGQIFRVDIDNGKTATSLVKRVKTLAKLGQTGSGASGVSTQRRFYEPPTVALFKDTAGKIFAAVGVGSGYRSHPLNEATTDRFYVIFDYDVPRADILTTTSLQAVVHETDLAAVKPDTTTTVDIAGKKGWYVELPDTGEKVITSALFFQNTLVFSSYVPSYEGGDVCAPVIGRSKLYKVSIGNGLPTGFTVKDYSVLGLGADPQLITLVNQLDPNKSDVGIVTGTDVEIFGTGISAGLRRTRWLEKTKQE